MTVWHILTCEYPPQVGGVGHHTRHLAEVLAESGDEVHVWCPPVDYQDSAAVHLHPVLGRFRARDWWRIDRALAAFDGPRRLLVQWVPHGFGYRAMNPWVCTWLLRRALAGDRIEVLVHEPFVELHLRPFRHLVLALVHRLMTVVLLRAASRVWLATSSWEARLRPYALGRRLRMDWLPVLTCRPAQASPDRATRVRESFGPAPIVGHFGSYGPAISRLLEERLVSVLSGPSQPSVLLLGVGSDAFRADLVRRHPGLSARVTALGYVSEAEIGPLVDLCDLFVQPYPDGITSRRTSALTCLARGRPVVTTDGHLTEPLWRARRAVALADVEAPVAFTAIVGRLLADPAERKRLGDAGRGLYEELFAGRHVLRALRAA